MMRKTILSPLVLGAALALLNTPSAQAQTWNEVGDAGQNGIVQAQSIFGSGALTTINGTLGTVTDIDLYQIVITNAAAFSATVTTYPVAATTGDSALYLFNSGGFGVIADDEGGVGSLSLIPTNSAAITAGGAGTYYLAMADWTTSLVPTSSLGNMFTPGLTTTGTSAPITPGNNAALSGWTTLNTAGSGAYTITLTGASFVTVGTAAPEPGSLALVGLGALPLVGLVARRRRKTA